MLRPILTAAVLFLGPVSATAAQTLALEGPDGQSLTLTATELAALPRQSVTLSAHGQSHVYEGPLLIDVVAQAGAPTGKALRGPALSQVVLVEASDGYAVALGLAEADPGTRSQRIILADKADGAPLSAEDSPFRLVVEGDLRPARSVRMVRRITVLSPSRAPKPSTLHAH